MCTTLPVKYPRQPVSSCPAFQPVSSALTDTNVAVAGSPLETEDQARAAPIDAGEDVVDGDDEAKNERGRGTSLVRSSGG